MDYAKMLRDAKRRRSWTDRQLTNELRACGIEVTLDGVKSWVCGRREPADRLRVRIDAFFEKERKMPLMTGVVQKMSLGVRVTSGVLKQVQSSPFPQSQMQIALSASLGGNGHVRVCFADGDSATLSVQDTDAIWRSHQDGEAREFFDRLYNLLSLVPDTYLRLTCSVEPE